jgi:mannose-6-phosphate isomerase-like protein (cupin superfamily)
MADQEIPIVYEFGVENVRDVQRASWDAVGCRAAFVQLYGMEGFTGMFVGELGVGEETRPQKHLYEEMIMIFDGHGEVEIWAAGAGAGERQVVQWQPYSLFTIPLNCWYTIRNTGSEPAIFTSVNNAPLVMDLIHDREFIFNTDYHFSSRFVPGEDFGSRAERLVAASGVQALRTNIIKDVVDLTIDADERRGHNSRITVFEMAGNTLAGHLAEWPPRRRQKAHYHAPGAVLLIARSEGYSLMWPSQAGIRPYESGNEDQVVRVDWREGSAFCPPDQWFHQHFNTGDESAKQVAIRYGSTDHPAGFAAGLKTKANRDIVPTRTSFRAGGTSIEFDDEDPRIFADYKKTIGEVE